MSAPVPELPENWANKVVMAMIVTTFGGFMYFALPFSPGHGYLRASVFCFALAVAASEFRRIPQKYGFVTRSAVRTKRILYWFLALVVVTNLIALGLQYTGVLPPLAVR